MARRPPAHRCDTDVHELLRELSARPAMNGGFAKLAAQQEEQCDQLKTLRERFDKWDKALRWVAAAAGTVAVSTLGRLIYDGLTHLHIVLQ